MKFINRVTLYNSIRVDSIKRGVRGCLLGLGVGKKYVGISVSDENYKLVKPVTVLVRTEDNIADMREALEKLISHFRVSGFVVGYPFKTGMKYRHNCQIRTFMQELSGEGKLEDMSYTFWDENHTSRIVRQMLKSFNLDHELAKTLTDKFASSMMLQSYLDAFNRNRSRSNQKVLE